MEKINGRNKISTHYTVKKFCKEGYVYTQRVLMTNEEFITVQVELQLPERVNEYCFLTLTQARNLMLGLSEENTYIEIVG